MTMTTTPRIPLWTPVTPVTYPGTPALANWPNWPSVPSNRVPVPWKLTGIVGAIEWSVTP